MDDSLKGRVAIVTGGSRGIGAGCARHLAARGAAVMVAGRDREALAEVAASITAAGGSAHAVAGDVSAWDDVERIRSECEATFGPCNVLLAFAGTGGPLTSLDSVSPEQWRAAIESNLTATFLTLRGLVPHMAEHGGGAVVTMASTAGRQPGGAALAYSAAKAGVIMLTRQLAAEVAPAGVRINCLAPSLIVTERTERLIPVAQREQLAASFPVRRLGTIDDIAHAVDFLVDERAGWITGAVLDITGGRVTG